MKRFLLLLVPLLALAGFAYLDAQTAVRFPPVSVEGTGAIDTGGITIEYLDQVPVQITSGTTVLDYRLHNSKVVDVTFSAITVTLAGDDKTKFTATPAHSSRTVPALGSIDSSITITTSSSLFDGEVVNLSISGTATDSAPASDFTPTITISRNSGVVPFGVTVSIHTSAVPADSTNLFHDAITTWTCSPAPASATTRHGPMAGFSFRTAGTYTISVNIRTTTGLIGQNTATVTASDFSGTTYYVDTVSGSNSYDGTHDTFTSGDDGPWGTYAFARSQLQGTSSFRLLLKVGQTHTMDGDFDWTVTAAGPIRVGPYGGAGKAVLSNDAGNNSRMGFVIDGTTDVTFYDLEARGFWFTSWTSGTTSTTQSQLVQCVSGAYDHITLLGVDAIGWGSLVGSFGTGDVGRLVIHDCDSTKNTFWPLALRNSGSTTPATDIWDFECNQNASNSGTAIHLFRGNAMKNLSVENSRFKNNPNTTGHVWKFHASGQTSQLQARYLFFYGCTIGSSDNQSQENCTFEPQGSTGSQVDELVQDVCIDACTFLGGPANALFYGSGNHVTLECRDATFRNSIFFSGGRCIQAQRPDATATVGGVRMLGCSWYANSDNPSGSTIRMLRINDGAAGAWGNGNLGNRFTNNAMYAPLATSASATAMLSIPDDASLPDVTDSNNVAVMGALTASTANYLIATTSYKFDAPPASHGSGIVYSDPLFVSTTNLHLQAGSPCIGAGIAIGAHTYEDADGVLRGGAVDVGAYER